MVVGPINSISYSVSCGLYSALYLKGGASASNNNLIASFLLIGRSDFLCSSAFIALPIALFLPVLFFGQSFLLQIEIPLVNVLSFFIMHIVTVVLP